MLPIEYIKNLAIDVRQFHSYSHWLVNALDQGLKRPSYKQLLNYLEACMQVELLDLTHVRPLLSINTGEKIYTLAHIEEDVLYLTLVLRIGVAIELHRRSLLENRVFSYRMDFKRPSLFIDYKKHPEHDLACKLIDMRKQNSTIITQTIEIPSLCNDLFEILYDMDGIIPEHVHDLELLYHHWNQSFPTESLATRILEEAYLTKHDNELVEKKVEFARHHTNLYLKKD